MIDKYNAIFNRRWTWLIRFISVFIFAFAICDSLDFYRFGGKEIYFPSLLVGVFVFVDTFVRSVEWFSRQIEYVKSEVVRPSESNLKNMIVLPLSFPFSLIVFYAVEELRPYVLISFYGFGFLAAHIVNVARYRKEKGRSSIF
ncbi:hypothetical protein [Thalassospira tepidiphila]|uniref:hypothetical protein n=1 Tax=Thalassospira tepidiphila TaxID=393657 RepID=UPI003AA920D0